MIDVHRRLVEAGLLPEEMPGNYTFNKVRQILSGLGETPPSELDAAISAALKLEVRGPLAALIFIKYHLQGAHEAEMDRVTEDEGGGARYGVLIYAEGELPVNVKYLPEGVGEGSRLRYEPAEGAYRRVE